MTTKELFNEGQHLLIEGKYENSIDAFSGAIGGLENSGPSKAE